MRRSLSLVLAAVAAAATVSTVPVQAGATAGKSQADEHQRIVDYWTKARRDSAIPRDVAPKGMAKPGGGGTGSTSVTGATWNDGGHVSKTTGKVFFTLKGVNYVCSASAAQGNANLVLTAGHCVHDGDGVTFATKWAFYPGYKSGVNTALGIWTATDLFTTSSWAASENFDNDAGFAVVTNGSEGSTLAGVLAANDAVIPTIAFDGPSSVPVPTNVYSAFGYPAAKKYNGSTLTYCAGQVRVGYDNHKTMALPCNMTGGSSGGPWLVDYASGARVIESLNSYGYPSLSNMMFGPIFGPEEEAAFDAATAGDCTDSTSATRCVSLS